MSECYKHERKRTQGSLCPYCQLAAKDKRIAELEDRIDVLEAGLGGDGEGCEFEDTSAFPAKLQEKNCEHPWHRSNLVSGLCPTCKMTVEQFNSELEEKP
jgi:hypothetical protein